MSGLRFPAPLYGQMGADLLADRSREACAIVFTRFEPVSTTWVVADVTLAPDAAYERRDAVTAVLSSAFLVEVSNRARADRLGVVLAHTHPWAEGKPVFSKIDDDGEVALADYFERRAPDGAHLALVLGPDGCRARRLGAREEVAVWEVGSSLTLHSPLNAHPAADAGHDRQIRAFGEPGQRLLKSLRVGLVGLGGTGSVVAQQLAHLGVGDFTLIDPDNVELTNLNRLLGAGPTDVGQPKVEVAARTISAVNPAAMIRLLQRDVVEADVAPALIGLDFIFLCTDSHASRAVVNQLAYQHLVPVIDMGVSITVGAQGVTHITGRVQMLSPELPCLVCTEALNSEQIRQEMMTPEQRAADPYVSGVHEPQPAVVSINSTMASLAVTMFIAATTPVPGSARFQYYDGVRGTVRPATANKHATCIACSSSGALSQSVAWSLPLRPTGAT